ncbi:PAS domain S-box-containing protein [Ureibacillus xyleni]|uniref:histidine kinase n=1 Tax=Ureibacillus xyleni TaxID=614648 RepID=A0A285T7S3_9BACL|nr:PAS domain S-box protein [Ureibacillus xyleni]SOC15573.1 PAS domain S-box-containing protein [Ureibacillus xyleni]
MEQIENVFPDRVISLEHYNQEMMTIELENIRHNFLEIMKQQQGMMFKLRKENGQFIHTLCEGKLLHRMGLIPEQVVGMDLKGLFPTDYAEDKLDYYQRAWQGEENVTYTGELNGIYYLASLSPIRKDGEVVSVIGSCVDITEQKRLEEKLKKRNIKYKIISDSMLDLVALLDKNGEVLYASSSYEKVLGYPSEKFIGNSALESLHSEDICKVKKQISNMIESKTPSQVELRYSHAKGGWVHIEAKISPVFDEQGEIEYFIAVGRDISERKRTEELLRRSEKLSIVGQLASSIAHEIRNPLTSIKGFVQLFRTEVKNPLFIETTLEEIDRIEEVIQEFLDFAQPQISKMEIIDVKMLLSQVLTLFSSQSKLQNIKIVEEYDQNLLTLCGDENQIKQVLLHILQNAVEAMPYGGMIKVQVNKHEANNMKISIVDNGSGISEERLKKIGEPFYSFKEKGTGLGLMISHKIVQEHGGFIEISSEMNKGTAVSVILPIKHSVNSDR